VIDAQVQTWARKHSLHLFMSWPGGDIRAVYLSSTAGECFQIWIDPPKGGQVGVHVACVEGRKDNEVPEDKSADISNLESTLEAAMQSVLDWMLPSERYYSPSNGGER
jgi:hypothetical protein